MTKLSPEGREQPAFILEYLSALRDAGRPVPQEIWDKGNGWVHYVYYGPAQSFRKSEIVRWTRTIRYEASK